MMVEAARSWFKENQTLVVFLVAQGVAVVTGAAYVLSYMVQLESRVVTLETRGSSHLAEINNRLTVTEKETQGNHERINRVVEIMLRELPVKREQLK
jgi:Tfp pilus assembly protein PilO